MMPNSNDSELNVYSMITVLISVPDKADVAQNVSSALGLEEEGVAEALSVQVHITHVIMPNFEGIIETAK